MKKDVLESMPWETEDSQNAEDYAQTTVLHEEASAKAPVFDLDERTATFGEAIIDFCKQIPRGPLTNRIIDQLVGCGTSIGANYCEADDAFSHKEFTVKINICRKEALETKFFLRMAVRAVPELKADARLLWLEANALDLIFSKIFRTAKSKND